VSQAIILTEPKILNAWELSKTVHKEVFLDGSIATSGPQKDRTIERLRENKNYLQTAAIMTKLVSSVLSLTMYSLILAGMANIGSGSLENIIFSLAANYSMVFVFQFMLVFTYGLIGLIGFFSSSAFKYLQTLPISKKKIQITAWLTYFRLINWQIVSIFIGLPIVTGIGMGLSGRSWIEIVGLVISSSIISFVNVIFLFSLMLLITLYLSKKIYKPTGASKAQTTLQIIITLLYAIVSLGAGLAITYLIELVQTPFNIGDQGQLINLIINFFLYPFGLTYFQAVLIIGSIVGWNLVPIQSILVPIVAFILVVGLTYFIFRRCMWILNSLTKEEIYTSKQAAPKDVVIQLELAKPFRAIYKKDMRYIFRNFQSTLYFIFPILMPLVLLIQIFGIPATGSYDAFFQVSIFTFFYSGMSLSFGITAVTAPESETGGLLYILPSNMKDIYRAKRRILYLSMSLSAIAPTAIMIIYPLIERFPRESLIPALFVVLSYYTVYFYGTELVITLYAQFFGKMRNRYTIQMLNIKHKFGKIALGMIILYVVCYIPIVLGGILGLVLGRSVFYGSIIMLCTAILLFGVIRWIAYKNFNSH